MSESAAAAADPAREPGTPPEWPSAEEAHELLLLRPRTLRWRVASGIWLIFLTDAFVSAARADEPWPVRAFGLVALTVFSLGYIIVVPELMRASVTDRRRRAFVLAAFVLATLVLPISGQSGVSLFVFVAVVAIMLLETREAVAVVAFLLVLAPGLGVLVPNWPNTLYIDLPIATASAAVFGIASVIKRNRALAEAHEELKTLAVDRERARFARDLHDLLGHSLTVITVKSELAGRLMRLDPQRAADEVADIERLAREALADVRTTVAGYRGVTLAAEVASARTALEAAGITASLPGAVDEVPGDRRELFGWVVREGVTNVVRHSRASRVQVSLSPTTVEVCDDGRVDDRTSVAEGNGLVGLRERLSAVGGRLEAGPVDGGGFRLYAEVPP
jgi:two-component system, NarL family, sensor histidine kinase DesK